MDWLTDLIWHGGKFLGIEWHFWKVFGWIGNLTFFSRFLLQWYATEKHKKVVVPVAFWWLSLIGSLSLLTYSVFHVKDSVVIFAYAFTWIPYSRNLIIHRRHKATLVNCPGCGTESLPTAAYCSSCGHRLSAPPPATKA